MAICIRDTLTINDRNINRLPKIRLFTLFPVLLAVISLNKSADNAQIVRQQSNFMVVVNLKHKQLCTCSNILDLVHGINAPFNTFQVISSDDACL